MDDAVRLTLEMNSYLKASKPGQSVARVNHEVDHSPGRGATAAASFQPKKDRLQQLLDRMDQLESKLQDSTTSRRRLALDAGTVVKGHLSRDCTSPERAVTTLVERPSMQ